MARRMDYTRPSKGKRGGCSTVAPIGGALLTRAEDRRAYRLAREAREELREADPEAFKRLVLRTATKRAANRDKRPVTLARVSLLDA